MEMSEDEAATVLKDRPLDVPLVNHVRFCETEAEVINERSRKGSKNEHRLEKLTKILNKSLSSKHSGKKRTTSKSDIHASGPPSILKHHSRQKMGVQQQYKDICIYINPKRLANAETGEQLKLLESLIGIIHQSPWRNAEEHRYYIESRSTSGERLVVHGLIPGSSAIKSGQILIGKYHNLWIL